MKAPFDFVVEPKGNRYNNTKKVGDKDLILNTEVFNHQYINREAIVKSVPTAYETKIKPGEKPTKISNEHLNKMQNIINNLNRGQMEIGHLETRKHDRDWETKGLLTSTPAGEDWSYQRFVRNANFEEKMYGSMHVRTIEAVHHGHLTQKYYDTMRASYSPLMAA